MNQRLPKANLCCILEIKADNEPGISLPVYFKLSKNESIFYEKNTKQNKRTKKKRRKFPAARVVPGTIQV